MVSRMVQKTESRVLDKIIVRLPDGMRDQLAEIAKGNNRSVNAEVVQALEAWVARKPSRAEIQTREADASKAEYAETLSRLQRMEAILEKWDLEREEQGKRK